METLELFRIAEESGVSVFYDPLPVNGSCAMEIDERCAVGIDPRIGEIRTRERLAHDLGHCFVGGFYSESADKVVRAKSERRSDKWGYYRLVPPDEAVDALRNGLEPWELAEHFNVSCEYMHQALEYYRSVGLV